MGSGKAPPFSFIELGYLHKDSWMISRSGLARSRRVDGLVRHCIQRLELLRGPFLFEGGGAGEHEDFGLHLGVSLPGPFQKEPVSLSKRFTLTIQSKVSKALRTLPALAPEQAGF